MEAAVKALLDGDIDIGPLITDLYRPEECGKAFGALTDGAKYAAKVLFDFT